MQIDANRWTGFCMIEISLTKVLKTKKKYILEKGPE